MSDHDSVSSNSDNDSVVISIDSVRVVVIMCEPAHLDVC